MNLDTDLQRILNLGAKVYHVQSKRQGRVVSVDEELVHVDYGNATKPDIQDYDIDDFKQMLVSDEVVAGYRLTMSNTEDFKIKPRQVQSVVSETSPVYTKDVHPPKPFIPKVDLSPKPNLETGYINFSTGRFSPEHKKGYTKVVFQKAVEKVTLELTSEQIEALKEMGLM